MFKQNTTEILMPYFNDLGAVPANEQCASLGHTPDFAAVNHFEIMAYRLAIIARHGLPPAGCRLEGLLNRHDFGDYRTLVLHVDNELDESVRTYADLTKDGLGTWIEAGFSPPVTYIESVGTIPRRDPNDLVMGALLATRPNPDGRFPVDEFAILHANLSAAFPTQAAAAAKMIASIAR